ncbi:hypothetical protein HK102_013447 [Quaeritorhiza haematococci]|nr:hypothetical protein HK102_013447 [Quaeritorhiza haematococci]
MSVPIPAAAESVARSPNGSALPVQYPAHLYQQQKHHHQQHPYTQPFISQPASQPPQIYIIPGAGAPPSQNANIPPQHRLQQHPPSQQSAHPSSTPPTSHVHPQFTYIGTHPNPGTGSYQNTFVVPFPPQTLPSTTVTGVAPTPVYPTYQYHMHSQPQQGQQRVSVHPPMQYGQAVSTQTAAQPVSQAVGRQLAVPSGQGGYVGGAAPRGQNQMQYVKTGLQR